MTNSAPAQTNNRRLYSAPMIPHKQLVWWYAEIHQRVDSAADIIGAHTNFIDRAIIDFAARCAARLLRNKTIFVDDEDIAKKGGVANKHFSAREDLLLRVGMDFMYYDVVRPKNVTPPFIAHRGKLPFVHAVYIILTESFLRATNDYMDRADVIAEARADGSIEKIIAISALEIQSSALEEKFRTDGTVLYGVVKQVRWHMMHVNRMKDKVIAAFQRLAMQIARQFGRSDQQILDNFQHGCTGLIRAANFFDKDRERAFSGLARNWIRANVLLHLKTEANMCKIPNSVWQAHKDMEDKAHEFGIEGDYAAIAAALRKMPDRPEYADIGDGDVAEVYQLIQINRPVSLENPVSEDGITITTQKDNIRDDTPSAETRMISAINEDLSPYMRNLTVEEQVIVCCLYGAYEQIHGPIIPAADIEREYYRQLAANIRMEMSG